MSHESKTFTWTSPGGVAVTLPSMKSIKGGVIRRNRKLVNIDPVDFMFTVLEETADEATLAQIDDLDTSDMNDLFEKWQKDGQTSLGESSGSSI